MFPQTCAEIAAYIVKGGKGLLAADESNSTMGKRLADIGVTNIEENRRAFRELLFTTPKFADYCGGVILFEETFEQTTKDGQRFVDLLQNLGVVPGIKVDIGAVPLAGSTEEKITEGLDGLREKFNHFYKKGARFAKWRAVIEVDENVRPTKQALYANAEALARYAALAQEAGIVPIVEPEVLMDGNHSLERCAEVTEKTLRAVFEALDRHHVALEGILLKPNMAIAGKKAGKQATTAEVAEATLMCLKKTVPAEVPGIVFLSGGQEEIQATKNLQAINALSKAPWCLTFSYGRALQQGTLAAWVGKAENNAKAQHVFAHRAQMNWLAANGLYSAQKEKGGL